MYINDLIVSDHELEEMNWEQISERLDTLHDERYVVSKAMSNFYKQKFDINVQLNAAQKSKRKILYIQIFLILFVLACGFVFSLSGISLTFPFLTFVFSFAVCVKARFNLTRLCYRLDLTHKGYGIVYNLECAKYCALSDMIHETLVFEHKKLNQMMAALSLPTKHVSDSPIVEVHL